MKENSLNDMLDHCRKKMHDKNLTDKERRMYFDIRWQLSSIKNLADSLPKNSEK